MSTDINIALAPERQHGIRDLVRQQRVVRVDELAETFQVSAATIRRDLEELENLGALHRVHGGAVAIEGSLEEPLFDDKTSIAAREKESIAEAALQFVHPKSTVYLDGGSTVLALARKLLAFGQLTVVTNSLRVAHAFSGSGPRMILVGGEFRRLSQTVVGPLSRHVLATTNFDVAFLGTVGVSFADGLTTTDPAEAFTKEFAISRAKRAILLADAAKFGRTSCMRFAAPVDLDVLITDARAPAAELNLFREAEVHVIVTESQPARNPHEHQLPQ